MGSWMMHVIIANKVAGKLPNRDKKALLLGGIAPDAVHGQSKVLSHFYEGDHENYSRNIAAETFYKKYGTYKDIDYILGYYIHLISDDLWLKGFYLPWLKNRMEHDKELFHRYHHDFQLLNGKLINHYKVDLRIFEDVENRKIPDLEEVSAEQVKRLLTQVRSHWDNDGDISQNSLQVFTLEQIVGYIETSVEISMYFLNEKGYVTTWK
ncbi:hydrolase [Virgibacillus soli]